MKPSNFIETLEELKEDDIKLKYRLSSIERIKESIADEFKTLINSALPEVAIYLGAVKHQ